MIFLSLNAGRSTALLLLDLSAAFDTTDQNILLNRLKHWFVVSSNAFNLLSSFLSSQYQVIGTSNVKSQPNLLEYGILQGSMLGPLLHFLNTTPLFSVISNHPGIQCHFYADHTQIYLLFSPELASSAFSTIKSCIRDVFSRMTSNKLSINSNKTGYFLFNPNNVNLPLNIINLSSNNISSNDTAKILDTIFQADMSMDKHISSVVESCFIQLYDFCCIHSFISKMLLSHLLMLFF